MPANLKKNSALKYLCELSYSCIYNVIMYYLGSIRKSTTFFKQTRTVCPVCIADILKWLYYILQRCSFLCLANPYVCMFKELFVLEGAGGIEKKKTMILGQEI